MSPQPRTVIVVDPDAAVVAELRRWLQDLGYEVLACGSVAQFRQLAWERRPACLVTEWVLPDGDGLEFCAEAVRKLRLPVVVLTSGGDIPTAVRAMRLGVTDFLTKPCNLFALTAAVELARRSTNGDAVPAREMDRLHKLAATLTPRERDVVRMVLGGLLNKEVAERLDLALITVKVHRGRAMRKLGARNAAELARIAHVTGLAETGGRTD